MPEPNQKSLNKLQKLFIVTRSLWCTFRYSSMILGYALVGRATRAWIDKISRSWASGTLKIIKLSYAVNDPYKTQYQANKSYIIMSNHSSLYDIPLIIMTLPGSVRMITKKELFRVPVWGWALRAAEFISIDRQNPRQAVKDLQIAKEKMLNGIIPWIAPEGTRSRSGDLQEFKRGGFMIAIKTGATIIPVGIRGTFQALPPKSTDFKVGAEVEINIGKPIDAAQYTTKNIDELMRVVKESIEKLSH